MLFSCLRAKSSDTSLDDTRNNLRMTKTSSQLCRLRALMQEQKLDLYLVPSGDPHGSEYVGRHDRRLTYLSGFTGSAGTAIISFTDAHLFVDGRYWQQAADQCDESWTIMKSGDLNVPSPTEWLAQNCTEGDRIGLDSSLFSYDAIVALSSRLIPLKSHLVYSANLIDEIWDDQPARAITPCFIHPLKYAGVAASEKLAQVRKEIEDRQAGALLVSDLSEIAWLLNLRASDIENCPVFYSYLLITSDETILFIDPNHFTDSAVARYLKEDLKVLLQPYEKVTEILREYEFGNRRRSCLMSHATPYALVEAAGQNGSKIIESFVGEQKAVKNPAELKGMEDASIQDAIAWISWIAELEQRIRSGEKIYEYDAGQLLEKYAKQQPLWFSTSYDPAVQSGRNGALPHYTPVKGQSRVIEPDQPLVVDIGQQYLNGTTDTSRTYTFKPKKLSKEQKRLYTRVLQGHIAVDTAILPKDNCNGLKLDVLARHKLWQEYKDYNHGTGHGIGAFLDVHEGPAMIGSDRTRVGPGSKIVKPGQVMSNEPGYYDTVKGYGFRIESAVVFEDAGNNWMRLRRLTRVPIQTSMVDFSLLTREEKLWLKNHNNECKKAILPLLTDRRARKWLKRQ